MSSTLLVNGASGSGTSDTHRITFSDYLAVYVTGTFDSVILEAKSPEIESWCPIGGGSFFSPEMRIFHKLRAGTEIRATYVGTTTNVEIVQ